ncbi:MAG TPA: D-amino-acid transaminase [Micropepsaceae bacterium]|jgi:D-alanine transaminase|nr:D-amino-acid transaminase [Micropepsaceae bacterium]
MSGYSPHARSAPAGRIAYVDGRYVPHASASVHVEDRGLQFADSIYEVCAILDGRLMDEQGHLDRLERSLGALAIQMPMGREPLRAVMREMIRRNRLKNGMLYLQITRGAHRRDHPMPVVHRSSLIMTARPISIAAVEKRRAEGIAVVTLPDIRWGRCDIKTTGLLPNVMAKTEARKMGAFEAWLVDRDGRVTEGASTNAWIVTDDGVLVTRNVSSNILAGVTRLGVLNALAREGFNAIEERAFTVAEATVAREAFVTSASGGVLPVTSIDGHRVGDGKSGAATRRIHRLYAAFARAAAENLPV